MNASGPIHAIAAPLVALLIVASTVPASAAEPPASSTSTLEDLVEAGRALWEEHAPSDLRAEYDFPDMAAVEAFLADLETALAGGSLEQLGAYVPPARRALVVLRTFEDGVELADWLEPRLDFLVEAAALTSAESAPPPQKPPAPVRVRPTRPGETPAAADAFPARVATGPHSRAYWQRVIARRPVPQGAGRLVPLLKREFQKNGVAPEWVWIAEVESSMNPKARSPAGARGLFQFMPATAERFGLRTSWPDERLDPEKSARAAAEYLRLFHARFDSWELALAAYNAGEGRVARALEATGARSFERVVGSLPAETRLYVPKVLATVALREGVKPERLPAPRAVATDHRPGSERSGWRIARRRDSSDDPGVSR